MPPLLDASDFDQARLRLLRARHRSPDGGAIALQGHDFEERFSISVKAGGKEQNTKHKIQDE
jgi:hypothetical protein